MTVGELLGDELASNPVLLAEIFPVDPFEVSVRTMPSWMAALLGARFTAITLVGTVWLKEEVLSSAVDADLRRLLVHELVHVRQWRVLGMTGFLVRYLADYGKGRLSGEPHHSAYRLISLEVEAREKAVAIT